MDLTLSPAALNTGAVLFGEYQHNHLLFIIINFQSYIFGLVVSLRLLWSPQRQPKHKATAALFCCGRMICYVAPVVLLYCKESQVVV